MVNITQFLNSPGEVRIISDIEGGDIDLFVNKIDGRWYNGKIIVTGDLIDSTTRDKKLFDVLSFNIRNLIKCVTYPTKIKYVLGNRDLNKIKVFHLTTLEKQQQLNPYQENILYQFNKGNIDPINLFKIFAELNQMLITRKINFSIMNRREHFFCT